MGGPKGLVWTGKRFGGRLALSIRNHNDVCVAPLRGAKRAPVKKKVPVGTVLAAVKTVVAAGKIAFAVEATNFAVAKWLRGLKNAVA